MTESRSILAFHRRRCAATAVCRQRAVISARGVGDSRRGGEARPHSRRRVLRITRAVSLPTESSSRVHICLSLSFFHSFLSRFAVSRVVHWVVENVARRERRDVLCATNDREVVSTYCCPVCFEYIVWCVCVVCACVRTRCVRSFVRGSSLLAISVLGAVAAAARTQHKFVAACAPSCRRRVNSGASLSPPLHIPFSRLGIIAGRCVARAATGA